MCQGLHIKEFGPTIKYIKGLENVTADPLSQNTFEEREHPLFSDKSMTDIMQEVHANKKFIVLIDYATIKDAQNNKNELKGMCAQDKDEKNFKQQQFRLIDLTVKQGKDKQWRIFIPKLLCQEFMSWYHKKLIHPGALCMGEII